MKAMYQAPASERHRQRQHDIVDGRIGNGYRRMNFVQAFIDGDARAETEDDDRDHEGPKIQLHPVAEGVGDVGRSARTAQAVEQEALIARIDQRVDRLAEHRRAAGEGGGTEFGHGDQGIARKCGVDHLLRCVRCHESSFAQTPTAQPNPRTAVISSIEIERPDQQPDTDRHDHQHEYEIVAAAHASSHRCRPKAYRHGRAVPKPARLGRSAGRVKRRHLSLPLSPGLRPLVGWLRLNAREAV